MKILTLVWSIGIGGTERAAVNNAIGYKQFGNDSKVLVLGAGTERLEDLQQSGVPTYILFSSNQKFKAIVGEFHEWMPDIIHIHNYQQGLLPYIEQLKCPGTKVVETNVFSRPRYERGYEIVSLSMQLSAWGYWKYTSWMKGAKYIPQVAIVPNIVIADKFKKPDKNVINSFLQLNNIPINAFVVGRLGQSNPSKWDNKIIYVIQNTVTPENQIFYLLVGAPDSLKEQINKTSEFVRSRVRLMDEIYGDEKLSLYYHSLNCFAHIAKIGESFGYVLAEALLCKVPAVTMLTTLKDNAQFEVVGHKYGGVCVTDKKQFVKAILKLYEHPEERNNLVKNLENWIDSRFSPSVIIPKQISYYNLLLAGNKIEKPNVSKVIKSVFKLYGIQGHLRFIFSKFINYRLTYLMVTKVKRLVK